MTRIGFCGLGKLGYPVAAAMAWKGYQVMGYDIRKEARNHNKKDYLETGPDGVQNINEWLGEHSEIQDRFTFGSLAEVADHSDIIFVAVQTPHDPRYEGITPLPKKRVDFDYKYLKSAVVDLAKHVKRDTIVVIISTVLPGTIRREILPLCNEYMKIIHEPLFIAMSTTIRDFLNPEFVLTGVDKENKRYAKKLEIFYKSIHTRPLRIMSIESAETTKTSYNTWISGKLAMTNTIGHLCHQIKNADCDDVMLALQAATDRIVSSKYMYSGSPDGGGCHPRDNIAMSYIAKKYNLHYDLFDAFMMERQNHCQWWVDLLVFHSNYTKEGVKRFQQLPMVILGYTFKPETNIVVGSPALLTAELLTQAGNKVEIWDPVRNPGDTKKLPRIASKEPRAYLIGCKHVCFKDYKFKPGSVVIDPHRYLDSQRGVELVSIGSGSEGS